MKKVISLICVCAVLCMTASAYLVGGLTSTDGELEGMTSLEVAKDMGVGWNLGNTMESCGTWISGGSPTNYETAWGSPVTTQACMTGLKAKGVNSVRIPVAWSNMMADDGKYTINSAYLNRVAEIVSYVLNADMYAIVNIHWDSGWWTDFGSADETTVNEAWKKYRAIWTQLSEYFKDYSYKLIFESANEELGDGFREGGGVKKVTECYALTNRINQAFVDTVRSSGGNNSKRFLLIAGYNTDIDKTCLKHFTMPEDTIEDRLLISVHYYTPSTYCIADKENNSWGYMGSWGTASDIADMETNLAKMTKFTSQGYGVVIGEYGVAMIQVNGNWTYKEGADLFVENMLRISNKYGYCAMLWDTANSWYNRVTCEFEMEELNDIFSSAAEERLTMTVPTYTASSSSSSRASASVTTKASVTSASSSVKTAVKPKVAKVKKVKAVKSGKKIKVSWKKIKGANGYKISVGTNKKAAKNKVIKTINNNKKKITVKIKKALNKKYYVKVRAYKNYKDAKGVTRKAWGAWSEAKKVKLR